MRGSRGCVRVSELRPWKIQISKNIVNLHIKITENTIIGTAPPPIGNSQRYHQNPLLDWRMV